MSPIPPNWVQVATLVCVLWIYGTMVLAGKPEGTSWLRWVFGKRESK